VVLLGTAGGPTWWPDTERFGISSAVVVGDAVYLVDCGEGTGRRYRQAGLAGEADLSSFNQLRAVFLTHLHSDHVADYPALMLFAFPGGSLGLPDRPVQTYGPGRRGVLPAVFPPTRPVPAPVSPDNPWPGTADMTDLLMQAFATDINDRIRDTGFPDIRTLFAAHDIALPAGADADPNNINAPRLSSPIDVYEDDRVRVTATLVDHGQMFPSFAYRFDTDDGAITFSGDTTVCDNLVALAQGTDILVHEVVDQQWIEDTIGNAPLPPDVKAAYLQHLIGAHTTIEQVGPVAQACGAKALVLSHFGPADNPPERWLKARRGFRGRFYVGRDLMELGVGKRVR
jgi:ribonuclease BN (tRNA processing enzyme)